MDFRKFTSGRYKLVVIAEDQHGEEVNMSKFYTLQFERQRPPKDLCLVVTINIEARVGKSQYSIRHLWKSAYVLVVMFKSS